MSTNDRQIVLMAEAEARLVVEEIKAGINQVGLLLFDLYDREGWRALGYKSWRECVTTEFDFGQSRAYQLLAHGKVIHNISEFSTIVEKPTNESQTRPLVQLEPADQAVLWQRSIDRAGGAPPTGQQVEQAVRSYSKADQLGRGQGQPIRTRTGPSLAGEFDTGPGIEAEFETYSRVDEGPGPTGLLATQLAAARTLLEANGHFVASPEELAGKTCPACGRE